MERLINRGVNTNTYLISPKNSEAIFIVDPGLSTENFIPRIKKYDFKKIVALITHHHFDHVYGLSALMNFYGKNSLQVIGNKFCSDGLKSSKLNLSYYSKFTPISYGESICIYNDNLDILINNTVVRVFQTPGHTLSSVSYMIDDCIFVGDLMIPEFRTVTNLPTGNKNSAIKSINFLLNSSDLQMCLVCPGHGDPFDLSGVKLESFINV